MQIALQEAGEMPVSREFGRWFGRAADGEPGFESVFFEFYPRVVGVLWRMLGDRARAEEIASDAFCKLAQQGVSLAEYRNVGGWLYRTATRLALNSIRAATRREHYEKQALRAGAQDDPLEAVLQAEKSVMVRAALARLKPAQARLLALRSQGLAYKEIAAALDVNPASIGSMLARAEAAFEKAYRRMERGREC